MSNSVIKQIKQKTDSGFSSSINLGAEQRYVGALRQSHNDNLEEQSILGVDCVTTETWSGDTHTIVKEFHDGSQSTNYYKLVTVFKDTDFDEVYIENGALVIDDNNEAKSAFITIRTDSLYFINNQGEEKLISTKTTQKKVIDNVVTTKEIISRNKNI